MVLTFLEYHEVIEIYKECNTGN